MRPYFRPQEYRDLLRLGSAEVLNNATNFFAENLDFLVMGRWLGVSALGLYNRCFYLTTMPVSQFSAGLSSVMFPLYSKIQGDVPRLRKAYLQTLSLAALVAMPVLFGMAAAPTVVIGGLFGQQWTPAAGTFRILCFSGSLWAILYVSGALSHACGHVFSEWWRQVIYFLVMALALWLLVPLGIEGVALAVLFATVIRYLLIAELSVKLAELRWRDFFLAQLPGCLLAAIVFSTVYLVHNLAAMRGISELFQLWIIIAASMLSLITSLLLLPGSWFGNLYPWLNERLGVNLPSWLRTAIAVKSRINLSAYGQAALSIPTSNNPEGSGGR